MGSCIRLLLTAALGSPYPQLANDLIDKYHLLLVDSAVDENLYTGLDIRKIRWLGEGYFEDIEKIIKEEKPDYYVPMLDEEIIWAHEKYDNSEVKLISPIKAFCAACLNKEDLMQYLRDLKISVVKTWVGSRRDKYPITYPCIVKPIVSRGSRGFRILERPEQFGAYLTLEKRKSFDVIRQEYLMGNEYTVSVVVNNKNQLMSVVPKRVIEKRGVTIRAVVEKNGAIFGVCEEIVEKMHPCGTFNVQLKMVDGIPKIFEINPRLSTTSILTTAAGVNEIDLMIEYWDSNATPFIQPKDGIYLYRRWENIIYD